MSLAFAQRQFDAGRLGSLLGLRLEAGRVRSVLGLEAGRVRSSTTVCELIRQVSILR